MFVCVFNIWKIWMSLKLYLLLILYILISISRYTSYHGIANKHSGHDYIPLPRQWSEPWEPEVRDATVTFSLYTY